MNNLIGQSGAQPFGQLMSPDEASWRQFAINIGDAISGNKIKQTPMDAYLQTAQTNTINQYRQAQMQKIQADMLAEQTKQAALTKVRQLQQSGQKVPPLLAMEAGLRPEYFGMTPYQQQQLNNSSEQLKVSRGNLKVSQGNLALQKLRFQAEQLADATGDESLKTEFERHSDRLFRVEERMRKGESLSDQDRRDMGMASAYFNRIQRSIDPQGNMISITQPRPQFGMPPGAPAPSTPGVLPTPPGATGVMPLSQNPTPQQGWASPPTTDVLSAKPKVAEEEVLAFTTSFNKALNLLSNPQYQKEPGSLDLPVAGPVGALQSQFGGAARQAGLNVSDRSRQLSSSLEMLKLYLAPQFLQERGVGISNPDRARIDSIIGKLDYFQHDDKSLTNALHELGAIAAKYGLLSPESAAVDQFDPASYQRLMDGETVEKDGYLYRVDPASGKLQRARK